jgi:hypothetical protein
MAASDGPDSSPRRAPRPERQAAFHLGISAESRAAAFLIAKGFRILARRWRMPPSRSISGNAAESPLPLKSGSRQIRTRTSAIVVLMQFSLHPAKFRGTSRRLLKQVDQALNRSKN